MATTNRKSAITGRPVWFITGCSTCFGRELAKHVLECGYRAVVTDRDLIDVNDLAPDRDVLGLKLDITIQSQIDAAIDAAEKKFGRIDVLVNNAGIYNFSSFEESEEDQVRQMFEINVIGLSRMIHAALPGMRNRRKGFIVNFSVIGGVHSVPPTGYYNATKYAVEGLSEAIRQEVEPLGIKLMLVEPIGFRSYGARPSANESKWQSDDYAAMANVGISPVTDTSDRQPGDTVRAAYLIVKAFESLNPPLRLLLGNDA